MAPNCRRTCQLLNFLARREGCEGRKKSWRWGGYEEKMGGHIYSDTRRSWDSGSHISPIPPLCLQKGPQVSRIQIVSCTKRRMGPTARRMTTPRPKPNSRPQPGFGGWVDEKWRQFTSIRFDSSFTKPPHLRSTVEAPTSSQRTDLPPVPTPKD